MMLPTTLTTSHSRSLIHTSSQQIFQEPTRIPLTVAMLCDKQSQIINKWLFTRLLFDISTWYFNFNVYTSKS
jgi:hypothetical protein